MIKEITKYEVFGEVFDTKEEAERYERANKIFKQIGWDVVFTHDATEEMCLDLIRDILKAYTVLDKGTSKKVAEKRKDKPC